MKHDVSKNFNIARHLLMNHKRECMDFPKKGVNFIDFNMLYTDPNDTCMVASSLINAHGIERSKVIIAPEARGFLLGMVMCSMINGSFVPARKEGKLPRFEGCITNITYINEYANSTIEMDKSLLIKAIEFQGTKDVIIYDDILATGGTAGAIFVLLEKWKLNLNVRFVFLCELENLKGRESLYCDGIKDENIFSLLKL